MIKSVMNNSPHFLIVGAPKAGTTSLYHYLQQHPRVFMPENKEPRFFCNYPVDCFEFGKKYFHSDIISTSDEYLALFEKASENSITGEASTDYLSCQGAAHRIFSWNPMVKIIIMLRDPIDRAFSEYQHSIAGGFQSISFWESMCLEKERISQQYDPIFWHTKRGLYFDSVNEYMSLFGRENVQIIFFEEFVSSTLDVVESILKFIGLSLVPIDVSVRHNAGKKFNDRCSLMNFLHKEQKIKILSRMVRYFDKGNKKGAKKALTDQQYEMLRSRFVDDVDKLSRLLNADLTCWL